jgi:phosphoribosylaminoimidazole carboxylase (NCAIR synthetase)
MPDLIEYRPVVMANLLGQEGAGNWRAGLAAAGEPDARFHWYGSFP